MIRFRPLAAADGGPLGELLDRIARHDRTAPFSEYKAVNVARGSGHTVVGTDDARIVTAGHAAFHHGDGAAGPHWAIEIAVDPQSRTPETVRAAFETVVAAVPDGARHVVWGRTRQAGSVLAAMGYSPVRRLARMTRPLPTGFSVAMPNGVSLSGFEPGRDEDAWLAVNNAAFAGHPENGGLTRDELAGRLALDWFRAEDLLMAWDGSVLVGSCWTKRHGGGVGEIYIIGVHPDHQRRGLGRALVVAGLAHLGSVGATTGMLYVDLAQHRAVRLYRALGFGEDGVTTMYALGGGG